MPAAVEKAYELARERYAALGVDTGRALERLPGIPISLHCWQGDDVGGFESDEGLTGGGIQATGNYPGKARTPEQLRADIDKAIGQLFTVLSGQSVVLPFVEDTDEGELNISIVPDGQRVPSNTEAHGVGREDP